MIRVPNDGWRTLRCVICTSASYRNALGGNIPTRGSTVKGIYLVRSRVVGIPGLSLMGGMAGSLSSRTNVPNVSLPLNV
jgi:hypothetical protein